MSQTPKPTKAAKPAAKPAKKKDHPAYFLMVVEAVRDRKDAKGKTDRKGVSLPAIRSHITATYSSIERGKANNSHVLNGIQKALVGGFIIKAENKDETKKTSHRYKLNPSQPKAKVAVKPKKAAVPKKKPVSKPKKAMKKPAVKKTPKKKAAGKAQKKKTPAKTSVKKLTAKPKKVTKKKSPAKKAAKSPKKSAKK